MNNTDIKNDNQSYLPAITIKPGMTKAQIIQLMFISSRDPVKRFKVLAQLDKFDVDYSHLSEDIHSIDRNALYLFTKKEKVEFKYLTELLSKNHNQAFKAAGGELSLGEALKQAGIKDRRRVLKVKLNNNPIITGQSIVDEIGIERALLIAQAIIAINNPQLKPVFRTR
jgi:hypothetical protein